jgi:hypothetical protein
MNASVLVPVGEILILGGVVCLAGSLLVRRAVTAAWSAAVAAFGLTSFWTGAVLTDHDNLEYGVRLGRLIPVALLLVGTIAFAIWLGLRRGGSHNVRESSPERAV